MTARWRVIRVIALALAVLVGSAIASSVGCAADATVYYVSPGGSDSNPGTLEAPWRTVQKAANTAHAGDTVYVRAGTYGERVTLSGAGTAGSPILIRGYGSERPLVTQGFYLSGSYVTVRQFEVTPGFQGSAEGGGRRAAINILGTHNTVDDVRVHDLAQSVGQECVFMGADAYGTLKNCDWTDYCTWQSAYVAGRVYDHNTVQDCVFHAASSFKVLEIVSDVTVERCDFIGPNRDMFVALCGKRSTLRDCVFYGEGRPVGDSTHTETMGLQRASFSPADGIIEGNTVDGCVFATPPTGTEWDPVRMPGVQWEVAPFHVFFFGDATAVTFRDNRFVNNVFLPGALRLVDMNGTNTTMGTQYFYNNLFQGLSGPALDNANVWRNNICGEGFEVRATSGGAAQDSDHNFYDSAHHASVPTAEGSGSILGDPAFVSPVTDAGTRYGLDADWHVTSSALRQGVVDSHSPALDKGGRTRVAPITVGPYEFVEATDPGSGDTTPPAVTLSAPVEGATVSGWVEIQAVASDADSGIARVEFSVDGALLSSDSSAPYAAAWDASAAGAGSHTLAATAYDVAGNSAVSSIFVTTPALPDVTPPGPVAAFAAVRSVGVALSWTNPSAADFAAVKVLRSTGRYATAPTDTVGQQSVYEGSGTSFLDSAAPEYLTYYTAYACDASGNWSTRACAQVAAVSVPSPATTSLVLTASTTKVVPGRSVILRGKLWSRGVEVRNRADVALWKKVASGVWSFDTTATFDAATGYYRVTCTPLRQTAYQMRFSGDTTLAASASAAVTVRVSSSVSRVTLSKTSVRSGARVALTVSALGPPASSVRVLGYRLVGKRWVYRGSYNVKMPRSFMASMRYGITVKTKRRGTWRFAAVIVDENGVTKGTVSRTLRVR
jgi:hypothetical protein